MLGLEVRSHRRSFFGGEGRCPKESKCLRPTFMFVQRRNRFGLVAVHQLLRLFGVRIVQ